MVKIGSGKDAQKGVRPEVAGGDVVAAERQDGGVRSKVGRSRSDQRANRQAQIRGEMSEPPLPRWLRAARGKWSQRGRSLPPFAVRPKENQESVWGYPRPPVLVDDPREVRVVVGGTILAQTRGALRLLETASPPTFYIPSDDVDLSCLRKAQRGSFCEWKGNAAYFDVVTPGRTVSRAAWAYLTPFESFAAIARHLSFYPGRVECWVSGERARPQPGGFYGGWVTDEVVGPFKGQSGTQGW